MNGMDRAVAILLVASGMLIASGCKKEKVMSDAMPAGYERVDAAFGIRTGGVLATQDVQQAPIAEFRTGGDYALYTISTDCKGNFSRSAGTVFANDGTIRDQIAAQPESTLSSNPQFAPLISQLCKTATASRFVADPFKPQDALMLLFGAADNKGEVKWIAPAGTDGEKPSEQLVSLRRSGEFSDGGVRRSYILTGSRNPACEAHACGGGYIGAAIFVFAEGKWVLEYSDPAVIGAGAYGVASPSDAMQDLHKHGMSPIVRIDSACFGNGGYCDVPTSIIAVAGGRFAEVWSDTTSDDNSGAPECSEEGHCTLWDSSLRLVDTKKNRVPDLEMIRKGKLWDADKGQQFSIDQKIIYRYDAVGKFVEASSVGDPILIPAAEESTKPVEDGSEGAIPNDEHTSDAASERDSRDYEASVDITSKNMNPPKYPPAAARAGVQGTVILIVDVDANGNVTNVMVEASSRNRDMDSAAMDAAREWRFNPGQSNGRKAAGKIRVPVDFKM